MNQNITMSLIIGSAAGSLTSALTANALASVLGVPGSVVIPVTLIGLGISFLISSGINYLLN
jgi:hypothetical protein